MSSFGMSDAEVKRVLDRNPAEVRLLESRFGGKLTEDQRRGLAVVLRSLGK